MAIRSVHGQVSDYCLTYKRNLTEVLFNTLLKHQMYIHLSLKIITQVQIKFMQSVIQHGGIFPVCDHIHLFDDITDEARVSSYHIASSPSEICFCQ